MKSEYAIRAKLAVLTKKKENYEQDKTINKLTVDEKAFMVHLFETKN